MRPLRTWLAVAGVVAIGDQAFFVVLSLFLLSSYGSGIAASFLTVASIARLALILVGGWAADRWSPYRCIQVGLVLRITSFLIVGLDSLGGPSVPLLSCGVILFGAGDGLYLPSSGALLKRLTNHGDFSRTISWVQVITSVATGLAGATSGFSFEAIPLHNLFFSFALLALAAFALFHAIPDTPSFALFHAIPDTPSFALFHAIPDTPSAAPAADQAPADQAPSSTAASLRTVMMANSGTVAVGLLTALLIDASLSGALNIVLPARYLELGWGGGSFGVAVCLFALGGVLGGIIASRIPADRPALRNAVVNGGILVFAALTCALYSALPEPVSLALVAALGLCAGVAAPTLIGDIMNNTPPEFAGRVYSAINLVTYGSAPLAYAACGFLMARFSTAAPFLVGAALLALGGAVRAATTPKPQ